MGSNIMYINHSVLICYSIRSEFRQCGDNDDRNIILFFRLLNIIINRSETIL